MSVQRILILAVALLAAIGALLLVRNASGASTAVPAALSATPQGVKILVASKDIPTGVAAQADMLTWVVWPGNAMNPAFVTEEAAPKAAEEFLGAVARVDILSGEPITAARLVKRGDKGFFAATIRPGYRAVAMPITRDTAAANFIMPNDRVDVVLARKVDARGRGEGEVRSDVILENVRVLSIGEEIKPKDGEVKPIDGAVATLELAPRDVETLALARKLGDLSLALRAVESDNGRLDTARRSGVRVLDQGGGGLSGAAGVKVHAYGRVAPTEAGGTE
ncbi:MAG: Flp pilus assembly protein CpaB [Caulobacterales bacterium]|jgi:pilus assembly protein CpaB